MKALATIDTERGQMIIYFAGNGEPMEAANPETGYIERLDYVPADEDDAIDAIDQLYNSDPWGLEWIEE